MDNMTIMMSGSNNSVADCLAECLSNAVVLSYKAQGHHWNVKGMKFSMFHEFFGEIYEDVYGSIDPLAENMLKVGVNAPYRLQEFASLTSISDAEVGSDAKMMVVDLLEANKTMLNCLMDCFAAANAANQQGVADFIAGRIDMHQKWNWQLSASIHDELASAGTCQMCVGGCVCPGCTGGMCNCGTGCNCRLCHVM
jgi:starvation-inducible DNA-binding protein